MKPAGIIGIVLIIIGIIALAYGGFSFKEHKKDVDIGPVQIGHTEELHRAFPANRRRARARGRDCARDCRQPKVADSRSATI